MSGAVPMLSNLFGSAICESFMAYVVDDQSLEAARELAEEHNWPEDAILDGGIKSALERLENAPTPDFIVADITNSEDPLADVSALRRKLGSAPTLLIIGEANDVDVFRRLVGAGASDYLVKPVTRDMLDDAVHAAERKAAAQSAHEASRLTVVIGVRGGVGASTVATNIAWIMAHELRANTALMDLDLHFGTTTLSLDLETGTGLREALESPHRIDKLFLDSAIVKESERLSVLGTEEPIDEVVFFNDNAVEALIKEVGQDYNQLVIDLPRALLPLQGPLLSAADNVVLVSDQTLAGIRDMNRVVQALNALAIKGQIVKVVSRVGKDRVAQVSRTDFERGINAKIDFVVPEDPKTLTICANAGKPIPEVAKKAPISKILEDIAKAASGKEEPQKKGLFGGFGKKKAAKKSAADDDERVDAQ